MEKAFGGGAERKTLGRSGTESILKPRHASDEIGFGNSYHKVVMITHENIIQDLKSGLGTGLPRCRQKERFVFSVRGGKNLFRRSNSRLSIPTP